MARDSISPNPRPAKLAFVSASLSAKNTPSTRLFFSVTANGSEPRQAAFSKYNIDGNIDGNFDIDHNIGNIGNNIGVK